MVLHNRTRSYLDLFLFGRKVLQGLSHLVSHLVPPPCHELGCARSPIIQVHWLHKDLSTGIRAREKDAGVEPLEPHRETASDVRPCRRDLLEA